MSSAHVDAVELDIGSLSGVGLAEFHANLAMTAIVISHQVVPGCGAPTSGYRTQARVIRDQA